MVEVRDLIRWMLEKHPDIVQGYKGNDHNDKERLNPFHLEGDCWTHLCMVMMCARDRMVSDTVKYSALFHDLGKIYTRRIKNPEKRWVSFTGHEGVSVWRSIDYLGELGVRGDQLIRCLQIISLHTELYKIAGSKESNLENGVIDPKFYRKFKYNKDLVKDLVQHTMCDGMGRFSDQTDVLRGFSGFMEYFIEELEDHKEYEEPWKRNSITLMIGLPCSGKSTYVENIRTDEVVLSRDVLVEEYAQEHNLTYNDAFIETGKGLDRQFNEALNEALKDSSNIIIDRTHMSASSRRRALSRVPRAYIKKAVVVLAPWSTIQAREKTRRSTGKSIPGSVYDSMMQTFMVPLYDEFDHIEYIFQE